MRKVIIIGAAVLMLSGCGGNTLGTVAAVAVPAVQQAALQVPAIANACATWRQARANPAIQVALGIAGTAATIAGYGVAEAGLDWVRAAGDRFCSEGPPAGDATSTAQRLQWLGTLTAKLLR